MNPMDFNSIEVVVVLATLVLGPAGAAAMGVRYGMNGMRASVRRVADDVAEMKADFKEVKEHVQENRLAIARHDEQLGAHKGWISRLERGGTPRAKDRDEDG